MSPHRSTIVTRVEPWTPLSAKGAGTSLVLLGTAGGPPWWFGSDRAGMSSAVVVGDAVYLVDCGEGWGRQYRRAGLGPDGYEHGIDQLRAVFLTHLHSDHTVDYGNLLALAWHNGSEHLTAPVQVYGPGDRGVLPPIYGTPSTDLPVVCPDNPTPGTVAMTEHLVAAFATDLNDRIRDYHKSPLAQTLKAHDIPLPLATDPENNPAPAMDPFVVHEDERVRVSAILVNHAPVFPAFAFRFDTDGGSIVFSGDTGPCKNLIAIADGADVLVHEAIDAAWVADQFPTPPSPAQAALAHHLITAHTTIEQVGSVAEAAGVGTLVLSHLVPGNLDTARWKEAAAGFSGQCVVGEDLMHIRPT